MADTNETGHLTLRGGLVAVITNGTAVLGLGNIGPLAGKPVMEGKAVLFKVRRYRRLRHRSKRTRSGQIGGSDRALEPTFGGINLEDIKAPECFYVEKAARADENSVFHDDRHGTAIIVGAAVVNGLRVVGKISAKSRRHLQPARQRLLVSICWSL